MEKKKNLLAYYLGLPEGTNIKFDPNDNTLLSSKLVDNNGNTNLFKLIFSSDAPEITQRIYENGYRNSY